MKRSINLMIFFLLVMFVLYFMFFLFISMISGYGITGRAIDGDNKNTSAGIFLFFILVATLITLIIQIRSLLREDESIEIYPEAPPEIIDYVKRGLILGADEEMIKLKLKEAGWPNEIIDSAFKEAKSR